MSQFLKIQITYQLILIYYFNLKKAKHLLKIFEFEKREIKCNKYNNGRIVPFGWLKNILRRTTYKYISTR